MSMGSSESPQPESFKLPVLEDDDEFSEFEQEDWMEGDVRQFEAELWKDDWDDDEAKADGEFREQLRVEMERVSALSQAK